MSEASGSSSADQPETVDAVKLASQLRLIGESDSSDDLALIYLDMIKEARKRAAKRLGLGDRLSLR